MPFRDLFALGLRAARGGPWVAERRMTASNLHHLTLRPACSPQRDLSARRGVRVCVPPAPSRSFPASFNQNSTCIYFRSPTSILGGGGACSTGVEFLNLCL